MGNKKYIFVHFIFRYELAKRKLKDVLKTKIWQCGYSSRPLCYQDLQYMERSSERLVHKLSATFRTVSDRSRQIHSRWQNNSAWTSSPLTEIHIHWLSSYINILSTYKGSDCCSGPYQILISHTYILKYTNVCFSCKLLMWKKPVWIFLCVWILVH